MWTWIFFRTSWQYAFALILVIVLSFWFELSKLAIAVLLGLAFCVGLATSQLLERWIAVILVLFSIFLFWYAITSATEQGISLADVLLINTELRNISKPMTGVYVCIIGATFIELINRFEKNSLTNRST